VFPRTLTVETQSVQSTAFESLSSRWRLRHRPHGSSTGARGGDDDGDGRSGVLVDFEVSMRVRDPVAAMTLDRVLEDVAERQVEAFRRRCLEVPYRQENAKEEE